jgi:hypothetical protein
MGDTDRDAKRLERRRRIIQAVKLPRVSGKTMAAALILCFILTGLLIPVILRKEIWIDAEFVVGTWWLIWVVALAAVLYRGHRVSDDHQMGQARNWNLRKIFSDWSPVGDVFEVPNLDAEGCAIGCLILAAIPLLILLAWFFVEIAIPALIFVAYFMVRGQLAHVVNDRHHCAANLLRSVAWGTLWATVYTAPIAGLVWFIHFAAKRVAT